MKIFTNSNIHRASKSHTSLSTGTVPRTTTALPRWLAMQTLWPRKFKANVSSSQLWTVEPVPTNKLILILPTKVKYHSIIADLRYWTILWNHHVYETAIILKNNMNSSCILIVSECICNMTKLIYYQPTATTHISNYFLTMFYIPLSLGL